MTEDEPRQAPGRATFRAVADEVRAHIKTGRYAPGEKLPTEGELADKLGTNRGTAAQALRLLSSEGLISKGRKGAFVHRIVNKIVRDSTSRYVRAQREEGQARGAFAAEMRRLGMKSTSVTSTSHAQPPAWVADILGVDARSTSVLVRARRMLAEDPVPVAGTDPVAVAVPVQLATSYIPLEIAEGTQLEEADTGPGGSKSRLAELGHAQATITEEVEVRTPTPEEVTALEMAEDQRVFEITHIGRTDDGRAVEVTVHVLPSHLWRLSYTWPLGPTH
ncbi:GntR family transcriptional regulator [Streptomyces violascens]|uniref:GntR family transcriptional regulator n=1 Tax=Streptomyces violascens TaxID=67381 RepID=UPI0016777B3E|nr:GntR family transcriptional regulator [Streptomyces violascens]GGU51250.1 GntR family transcriptional regulator [Streptomyces violascens]